MTVFKTFLKVLNKYKGTIILYTILLIGFAASNMRLNNETQDFSATKPDVLIINEDGEAGITKNLIDYIKSNCNIENIKNDESSINDALFYRDISLIIYIPKDYHIKFMNGNDDLEIKETKDYEASLGKMLLNRYLKVASLFRDEGLSEEEIITNTKGVLENTININLTSKVNTTGLSKIAFYYNFLNYSILAGCVYVICLILSSFRNKNVSKRTIISSVNYKSYNRKLLLSNGLFAVIMWVLYVILSFILVGNNMFSMHGLLYIINSFVFTICALTLAFLIGNLLNNKNAINGIINVVALGSSFLCGAFVPAEFLPSLVLSFSRILPSYWYINSNDLISSIEEFSYEAIKPVIGNMLIVTLFSILFINISNIIYKRKTKIG